MLIISTFRQSDNTSSTPQNKHTPPEVPNRDSRNKYCQYIASLRCKNINCGNYTLSIRISVGRMVANEFTRCVFWG